MLLNVPALFLSAASPRQNAGGYCFFYYMALDAGKGVNGAEDQGDAHDGDVGNHNALCPLPAGLGLLGAAESPHAQ